MMPRCSKTIKVLLQDVNAAFGNGDVILLRDLYFAMSHLITEQVRGRVHLCHHGSVGVPQVMVLELHLKPLLDLTGGVLKGVDGLDGSIGQTVDQLRGVYLGSVHIFDQPPLLFPQGRKPHFILLPLLVQLQEVGSQGGAHIDGSVCVLRLRGNQLDKPLLVLHLPVNRDGSLFQVHIRPLQTEALIDPQTAVAAKHVGGFGVGSSEVVIQKQKLLLGKGHNLRVIIGFQLRHGDLGGLVHAELVVGIHIHVIAGIGLPEEQVEHLQEPFNITIRQFLLVV